MVADIRNCMVRKALYAMGLPEGRIWEIRHPYGDRVFYTYYQISRDDQSDETETEPKERGELKSHWEGSHSPFGFVWQIASATGWSVRYILYGVNYQTLIMMLSDAPRYVNKKVSEKKAQTEEEEANDIVGFFQSNLKG